MNLDKYVINEIDEASHYWHFKMKGHTSISIIDSFLSRCFKWLQFEEIQVSKDGSSFKKKAYLIDLNLEDASLKGINLCLSSSLNDVSNSIYISTNCNIFSKEIFDQHHKLLVQNPLSILNLLNLEISLRKIAQHPMLDYYNCESQQSIDNNLIWKYGFKYKGTQTYSAELDNLLPSNSFFIEEELAQSKSLSAIHRKNILNQLSELKVDNMEGS